MCVMTKAELRKQLELTPEEIKAAVYKDKKMNLPEVVYPRDEKIIDAVLGKVLKSKELYVKTKISFCDMDNDGNLKLGTESFDYEFVPLSDMEEK